MAPIVIKRFQQAAFEAISSQNRFAGSGGGNGMVPMLSLGAAQNFSGAVTINTTTFTQIPNVSSSVVVPRTCNILVWARIVGKVTGSATYANGDIFTDGANNYPPNADSAVALWDTGVGGFTMSGGWLLLTVTPGSHTFDYRISVQAGNTWANAQSGIQIWLMGY